MFNLRLRNCAYFSDSLLKNVRHICENLNENFYFAINDRNQIVSIKNRQVQVVYDLNEELSVDCGEPGDQANNGLDKEVNRNEPNGESKGESKGESNIESNGDLNKVPSDSSSRNAGNRKLLNERLIGFGHLPDLELICLIYANGAICTVNLDTKHFDKIELGYPLVTADFSPEYDKIVLTTERRLVLLNSFFEEINCDELNDQKQGAVDVLNCGWGRKETQFHGSEGKQARTAKKEISVCSKFDDLKPRVTWRDDGVYFATSVVDSVKSVRKIRIYDNEGVLQQASDEHSGLEYSLSWKPNGNLITSSVSRSTGHFVVFFEKNGQLFDEFRLPYGKEEFELQQIVWSSVADCVAILGIEHAKDKSQVQSQDQLQNKSTDNQQRQVILIYSMRNFHWYCQQKLVFTTATVDGKQPIRKLMNQVQSTNEFQPLALLALFDDGRIGEFVYANAVCCTSSGDCAVIDGRSLLLTPFQHSAVPPPMYGYSLRFHAEINEVCFSQPTGAYLLVQLADQTLHLIERSQSKQIKLGSNLQLAFQSISFKQPNLPPIYSSGSQTFSVAQLLEWVNKGAAELDAARQDAARQEAADQKTAKSINQIDPVNKSNQPGDEIRLYQLHLTDKKVCYALCSSPENNNQLIGVDLEHAKTNTANQSMQLICLNSSATNQFLVSVDSDGFVWKFSLSTSLESTGALESNASHLTPFQVKNESNQQLKLGGAIESIVRLAAVGESHVVALYTNYQLHINGRSRGAGCNSFLAHDFDLLLYTTNDHQLRSIWLGGKLNSSFEHKHRMVERGSRLITSCSSDCKVVLQMPRGNLELITPRLLLLDRIKLLLNTLQYRSAFMLMKKHRINLNLIVDFDLECFLINAVNFIQQIAGEQTADQIADLCLFLSELAEPNVLHTLYVDYHQYVQALNGQSENKPGSLFDKRFPELRPKACAANLGDPDCVDGKEVHLEKWFLDNFSEGLSEPSKLDSVSCTLRHEMAKLNDQKYFLPILLTYLKQTRPSVSTALLRIHRQSDKELRASSLNYLKYILEMHVLVKEALASYDLSAAKMVYAVSNLDPKEYLPLLARLEAYEPAEYRAYQIDMHLKRYDQALANLVLCRPFAERATEALELIEQKHLYQLAIGLFGAKSELCPYLNQIYSLYGDYLLVKKYFSEALIVYKKGENYVNAIKAAQLTNNWNQIIECASLAHKQQAKMAGEETEKAEKAINLTKIYQSVAEQLDNTRDAKNSSFIYAFYLNDWYQAVRVLIKNYRWADVFRLLNDESFLSGSPLSSASASTANSLNDSPKNGVDDPSSSISNPTDPASPTKQTIKLSTEQREELISLADQTLAKHYEEMVDYLNESLGELRKHTERLEKVRELKLALKEQMSRADDLNELEDEFLDSQSTISTVSSVHSGKRKSAKGSSNQSQTNSLTTNQAINKKKKDKKRKEQMYRLKPGSRDEDLALIYHIRQRIKSIEKQRSTVKLLIGCLAERGVDYKAVRLQIMFGKLLEVAQFVISVVWREADEQAAQNELSTSLIPDIKLQNPPKLSNDTDWKFMILNHKFE